MSKQDFGPNYSLADVRGTPEHRIAELEADVRLAINQRDQAKADFANMATHPSNPLYAENQRLLKDRERLAALVKESKVLLDVDIYLHRCLTSYEWITRRDEWLSATTKASAADGGGDG